MKTRISLALVLALALGMMPIAGGCAQTSAQPVASTNSVDANATATAAVPATNAVTSTSSTNTPATQTAAELAEKPVAVKSAVDEAPPANLKVTPALREVLKMVKAGVSKDVLSAYVTGSKQRFALGPDEIIYLSDLGLADDVTTAMLERDLALRAEAAALAVAAPEPATMPEPVPATVDPAQYAPQYETQLASAPVPAASPTLVAPDSDAAYFYDSLAPYGSWVNIPSYGPCWQPTVGISSPGWRPYLDGGRWVSSDLGWYWLSDYSWGWAPFHYGRWFYHARNGWVWHPGRTWGPAWVSWRNSDLYCGWAPLPPEAGFVSSLGLTWHGGAVGADFEFGLGWTSYCFLPVANFCDFRPRHRVVHHDRDHDCWQRSKVVNKIRVKGDNNTVIVDANGRTRVRVNGDDNHVGVNGRGSIRSRTRGDDNTVVFEGGADPRRVETASHQPIRRVNVRDSAGESGQGRRGDRIEKEGADLVVYRRELPERVSERTRSAVARVATQPDRINDRTGRNEAARNERLPENLKAVDTRNNRINTGRPAAIAVAPPVANPDLGSSRPSTMGRNAGNGRGRQESAVSASSAPRVESRQPAQPPSRPRENLIIRGNQNATARMDRSAAQPSPEIEASVRSSDARTVRSGAAGNPNRANVPTPVTRATPIMEPYQIEHVQPIRVWNTPLPQASQPAQMNQRVQPAENRYNNNGTPNGPIRNYTPAPDSTAGNESFRQNRNSGGNESRASRSPGFEAPARQAPAPVVTHSAPERSRSESARVERSGGGGDNNVRSGGGGGGGGGGRNDGGGNQSSGGRNR